MLDPCNPKSCVNGVIPDRFMFSDFADSSYDVWEEEFRNSMGLSGFRKVFEGGEASPENTHDTMSVISHLIPCISDDSLDVISYGHRDLMRSMPSICLQSLRSIFSEENKECRSLNPPKRRWCEVCKSRMHSTGKCNNEVSESEDEEVIEYPMAELKQSVGDGVSNVDTGTAMVGQAAQVLILSTDDAVSKCGELEVAVQKIECSDRKQHHREMGVLSVNGKSVELSEFAGNVSNVAIFTESEIVISVDDTGRLVTKDDGEKVISDVVHENVMELVSSENTMSILCNKETKKSNNGVFEAVFVEQQVQLPSDVLYIEDNNTTECLHKCAFVAEVLEKESDRGLCEMAKYSSEKSELNSVYCEHGLQRKKTADESKLAGFYCVEDEKKPTAVFSSVDENIDHNEACKLLYMTKFGDEECDNSVLGAEIRNSFPIYGVGVESVVDFIQTGGKLAVGKQQEFKYYSAAKYNEIESIKVKSHEICLNEGLWCIKVKNKHRCMKCRREQDLRKRGRIKKHNLRDVITIEQLSGLCQHSSDVIVRRTLLLVQEVWNIPKQ